MRQLRERAYSVNLLACGGLESGTKKPAEDWRGTWAGHKHERHALQRSTWDKPGRTTSAGYLCNQQHNNNIDDNWKKKKKNTRKKSIEKIDSNCNEIIAGAWAKKTEQRNIKTFYERARTWAAEWMAKGKRGWNRAQSPCIRAAIEPSHVEFCMRGG